MNDGLKESLDRIMAEVRARRIGPDEEPAPFKCGCQDTGMVRMESGRYDLASDPAKPWRHTWVDASPERPIYVRCQRCNALKPAGEGPAPRKRQFGGDA